MTVFVTVGMGRWQFDRLLLACIPLCNVHSLVVQTGTSKVDLPCKTKTFMQFDEVMSHIKGADVIITHAGNTVRIVQKLKKVPIAIAREKKYNEMANDHQMRYLKNEAENGWVVPVWNTKDLPDIVENHLIMQEKILLERPFPKSASTNEIVQCMDGLCSKWIKKR